MTVPLSRVKSFLERKPAFFVAVPMIGRFR